MRPTSAAAPALPGAFVTSASLLGDTFLYTVLPVSAARLGMAPLLVGVVLSINRWVRLLTNPLAGRLYARLPAGALLAVALPLAAVSTALYAEPTWVVVLLAGRLLWGLCFSLLRLGSYLAAVDDTSERAGRRLGEIRGVFGVGYLAGALYAPFALEAFGWRVACLVAAGLTFVGGIVPAALVARWRRGVSFVEEGTGRASVWEPRLALLFVIGAAQLWVAAGIIPVAGGIRIAELFPTGGAIAGLSVVPTFIAAAFVLTQRVAQVVWQPFAGRLADRALDVTFAVSTVIAVASVLVLLFPIDATMFVLAGLVTNFAGLLGAIGVELAVARRSTSADRPRVLAAFHTWQDGGAAVGALAGGALVGAFGTISAIAAGEALVVLSFPLWWLARRAHVAAAVAA
ncbi:MAG: MFS transporter [Candidatus Limnocylindria bacterium]